MFGGRRRCHIDAHITKVKCVCVCRFNNRIESVCSAMSHYPEEEADGAKKNSIANISKNIS